MSPPPAGRSRWTARLLAKRFGISSGTVSDVCGGVTLNGIWCAPYKVSRDREFAR